MVRSCDKQAHVNVICVQRQVVPNLNSPHTDHFFLCFPLKTEWCSFSYFPLKGEFQTVVLTFVLGN